MWVGSNNLTRDGLLNNVEFALLVKASEVPQEFTRWAKLVDQGSIKLSSNLLESYMRQRRSFEKDRAKKGFVTFILQEKDESTGETRGAIAKSGDLVVEVMPKETGGDGRQMQLPVQVAADFFGLKGVGSTKDIHLCAKGCAVEKILTMRVFRNNTARITISDLEYRDRPCVLVFRKVGKSKFSYEIVSKSIFPSRYKYLLDSCNKQTRAGSRRWGGVHETSF